MIREMRKSIILMFGTGAAAGLGLAYLVVAARVLGPEAYAVFSAAVTLVTMCQLGLGPINETITRFSAVYASEGNFGRVKTLAIEVGRRVTFAGLMLAVVGLLAMKPIAGFLQFDSYGPLLVAYVMILLLILLGVVRGVLRGVQRFGAYNANIITESSTRLLIGLALLVTLGTVSASLVAYVVGFTAALALSFRQLRMVWGGHERQSLDGRAVRRFTVPMFATMLTYAAFHNVDMLLVKHFFAARDAGVYGAAFNLARMMATVVTPFSTLLVPLLTSLHTEGKSVTGPFVRVVSIFGIIAFVVIAAFGLFAHEIFALLFTPAYASGASLLLPLAIVRLTGFLAYLLALAGVALGRFAFLWGFVPGLAAEVAVLWVWHDSLATVVHVIFIVQGLTLVCMVVFALPMFKRPFSPTSAPLA